MPVVFDTSFLIPLLDDKADVTRPVRLALVRLESEIQKLKDRIVVPAPALAEFLTRVADPAAIVDRLNRSRHFQIAPFGMREAVELAAAQSRAEAEGDKRGGATAPWNKVKYDRQIVATAAVLRVSTIYSNDRDIKVYALPTGVSVIALADLPAPAQGEMFDE